MIQNFHGQLPGGMEWIFLLIIGIIVATVIALVRKMIKKKGAEAGSEQEEAVNVDSQNEKAMKILRQRLAKGEITKEEYDNLKKEFE